MNNRKILNLIENHTLALPTEGDGDVDADLDVSVDPDCEHFPFLFEDENTAIHPARYDICLGQYKSHLMSFDLSQEEIEHTLNMMKLMARRGARNCAPISILPAAFDSQCIAEDFPIRGNQYSGYIIQKIVSTAKVCGAARAFTVSLDLRTCLTLVGAKVYEYMQNASGPVLATIAPPLQQTIVSENKSEGISHIAIGASIAMASVACAGLATYGFLKMVKKAREKFSSYYGAANDESSVELESLLKKGKRPN